MTTITLSEAIQKKYFDNFFSQTESRLYLFMPKLQKHSIPSIVIVSGQQIESAGDVASLRQRCRKVEQLDLSKNAIKTWKNVIIILRQLPNLKLLNISFNRLWTSFPNFIKPLPALRCLVLNGIHLKWNIIGKILDAFPHLNELHLNQNGFSKILLDMPSKSDSDDDKLLYTEKITRVRRPHENLKTLYFRKNAVRKWSEICRLGRLFPSLECLILSDSSLDEIACSKDFQHLIHINLNDVKISSWEHIDHLAQFPSLTALHCRRWPLWNECGLSKYQIWLRLIVRLPDVKHLNGSLISIKDREDAYRDDISNDAS